MSTYKSFLLFSMKAPSEHQKKVINGLIANISAEKPKSRRRILLEAGYTESTARQAKKIIDAPAVTLALEKEMEKFQKIRDQALFFAAKKAPEAPYAHLVDSADKMQKQMNLMKGRATEHVAINVTISEVIAKKNE